MSDYVIEKGFPMSARQDKYPFTKMDIGDSFVVPASKTQAVRKAILDVQKNTDLKFATRKCDGGLRVFRTGPTT